MPDFIRLVRVYRRDSAWSESIAALGFFRTSAAPRPLQCLCKARARPVSHGCCTGIVQAVQRGWCEWGAAGIKTNGLRSRRCARRKCRCPTLKEMTLSNERGHRCPVMEHHARRDHGVLPSKCPDVLQSADEDPVARDRRCAAHPFAELVCAYDLHFLSRPEHGNHARFIDQVNQVVGGDR